LIPAASWPTSATSASTAGFERRPPRSSN
jgi:hypothetical protein